MMKSARVAACCCLIVCFSVAGIAQSALSNTFPSRKTWWAKQIADNLYVAGRLTESQIKYASESGFRTLVALSAYESEEMQGGEVLPDQENMKDVAERLGGMTFHAVLGEDWARRETVAEFSAIMSGPTGGRWPVLLTSFIGRGAAFVALAYMANKTTSDPSFRPRIDSAEFYGKAAGLGYIFDTPPQTQLIAELTGQPVVSNPPKPELSVEDWANNYWLAKPVYKNIYICGQIRANYLQNIADARFDVIFNLRRGTTTPPGNAPSQEEVTLLNIMDRTGTYDGDGRQSEGRLLDSRIDSQKSNEYVGAGSSVNYASRNPLEFGDDIGYNETMGRLDIEKTIPGVKYIHTPVGGQYTYGRPLWEAYKDAWLDEAKSDKVILIHCRTAYRSAVAAMLIVGHIEGWNSTRALARANELGFHFEQGGATSVVQLFKDVLDVDHSSVAPALNSSTSMLILIVVLIGQRVLGMQDR